MHLVRALSRAPRAPTVATALRGGGATRSGATRTISTSSTTHSKAMNFDNGHAAWFLERGAKPAHRFQEMYDFWDQDVPWPMHEEIQRYRVLATYARLVENELPRLSEFATPFRPPGTMDFLRVRTYHHQGHKNDPNVLKARLDFPIEKLFASGLLPTKQARKKFLQIAGQRWDPSRTERMYRDPGGDNPPYRSLERITWDELFDKGLGWVRITCQRFPNENQNIKWVFDRFDEMVAQANQGPYFDDVPLSVRHILTQQAKKSKAKRANGPTYRTFPQAWLPENPSPVFLGGYSNKEQRTAEPWQDKLPIQERDTVPPIVHHAEKLGYPVSLSADAQAAQQMAAKKRYPWTVDEYLAAMPGQEAVSAIGGRPKDFKLAVEAPPQEEIAQRLAAREQADAEAGADLSEAPGEKSKDQ